jgi:hypothetical protein
MRRLGWAAALGVILLAAAGCTSNEPEGFKPGDTLDLNGNPRKIEEAAPPAPGAVAPATRAYTPDAAAKTPSPAEQRSQLGYTPDAAAPATP